MSKAAFLAIALAVASCGCDDDDEGSPSSSSGGLEVSCSATPTAGPVPLTVQFSATISGAGEGSPVLSWSFGDGTAASVATAARTYIAPGVYNAGAEVRSGGRRSSCNVTITAQSPPRPALPPNAPPVARFKTNPNPPAGTRPLTVDFNACQSSDPDGDRLLFRFDVFDGLYDSHHCRREHTPHGGHLSGEDLRDRRLPRSRRHLPVVHGYGEVAPD